jgi:hypothetical protein
MLKTGYIEIASLLVTVARSCFLLQRCDDEQVHDVFRRIYDNRKTYFRVCGILERANDNKRTN